MKKYAKNKETRKYLLYWPCKANSLPLSSGHQYSSGKNIFKYVRENIFVQHLPFANFREQTIG